MQEFAKSKGMEVIPLVQTFGHMEVSFQMVFCISVCPYFPSLNDLLPSLFYHSLC